MKHPKFEVYKAKDGWRWRLKSANGKIIAEGGEAHKKKPDVWLLFRKISDAILMCMISFKVKP